MSAKFCGTAGSISSVVFPSSSEVSSCGSRGTGGCNCWFLTCCKVSLIGDLLGVGLTQSDLVKSELRYLIIQVIRSQWESQDLPALGNQYHVTDDTASQEQGYNT